MKVEDLEKVAEDSKKAWYEYIDGGWKYNEAPDKQDCFTNGYKQGYIKGFIETITRMNDASNDTGRSS